MKNVYAYRKNKIVTAYSPFTVTPVAWNSSRVHTFSSCIASHRTRLTGSCPLQLPSYICVWTNEVEYTVHCAPMQWHYIWLNRRAADHTNQNTEIHIHKIHTCAVCNMNAVDFRCDKHRTKNENWYIVCLGVQPNVACWVRVKEPPHCTRLREVHASLPTSNPSRLDFSSLWDR